MKVSAEKTITKHEFNEMLAAYLVEQGPNPGTSNFGSMAWRAMKEKELFKKLRLEGITVIQEGKASVYRRLYPEWYTNKEDT